MKKLFYWIFLFLALSACKEEDYIWDFENYSVEIEVRDAESGVNLLDPEVEGNILDQEIVLIYKREKYPMASWGDESRANISPFRGLLWGFPHFYGSDPERGYCLTVGPFDTGYVVNVPFTIDWGDGTKTEFVVTSDVKNASSKNPTIIRALTVNSLPIGCEEGRNWLVILTR